jgi:PAS domain S-box-containing protein
MPYINHDTKDPIDTETAPTLSEARCRRIIESVQEGIVLLDEEYTCIFSNPKISELLGYPAEKLHGRRLSEFVDNDWRASTEHVLNLSGGNRTTRRNLKFRRQDGSEFWGQVCFSPIDQRGASQKETLVVVTDFTERMRLEELLQNHVRKLENIVHRKDEFLAQLGHELRNPLAPLSLSAHLLKNGSVQRQDLAQCYDSIERQTRHLARLVDDLLDVSCVGLGVIHLRKQSLALPALIHQAAQLSSPYIHANRQQLEFNHIKSDLRVEGDETRLLQVLTNLLNNAAKFTPPDGHISVTLQAEGSDAVIRIKDDGIGIAPEQLHRVFELFSQVSQPASPGNDGLGVGLYLAHELVGLHGGRLEAHSDGPGSGSEFAIYLPLIQNVGEEAGRLRMPLPASHRC